MSEIDPQEWTTQEAADLFHGGKLPPIQPPWKIADDYDFNSVYPCPRCGETIPPRCRHFWRPCECTYHAKTSQFFFPRPDCEACDGTGFHPCAFQDLSILRMSGACKKCGVSAYILVGDQGVIAGSGRHHEGEPADHPVNILSVPLERALNETFTRSKHE